MREIDKAKMRVEWFKDKEVLFKVNIGRNRFISFLGIIDQIHPSVFTIKAKSNNQIRVMSYTYADVMTKVIRFYEPKENKNTKLS